MTVREWALVTPLLVYALAVTLGGDRDVLLLPFAVAQVAGIVAYILEVHNRYVHRNGQR